MTREEAMAIIVAYDNAVADSEKRPKSKAAADRYWKAFNRLLAAVMGEVPL